MNDAMWCSISGGKSVSLRVNEHSVSEFSCCNSCTFSLVYISSSTLNSTPDILCSSECLCGSVTVTCSPRDEVSHPSDNTSLFSDSELSISSGPFSILRSNSAGILHVLLRAYSSGQFSPAAWFTPLEPLSSSWSIAFEWLISYQHSNSSYHCKTW